MDEEEYKPSEMSEAEALAFVTEIGTAFENDLNDGEDDSPDWHGLNAEWENGNLVLVYHGESWNGEEMDKVKFVWTMTLNRAERNGNVTNY